MKISKAPTAVRAMDRLTPWITPVVYASSVLSQTAVCSIERRSSPMRANSVTLFMPRPNFFSGPAQPLMSKAANAAVPVNKKLLRILDLIAEYPRTFNLVKLLSSPQGISAKWNQPGPIALPVNQAGTVEDSDQG